MIRAAACTAVAVFALAGPSIPQAHAKKRKKKAVLKVVQKYVELGESLFHAGDFGEAASTFRKAVDALDQAGMDVPAGLHRSIARCHDQAGEVPEAVAAYERFLDLAEPGKGGMARRIKEAEDALRRLEQTLKRTALRFDIRPADARVTLDGEDIGPAPEEALPVAPGEHTVVVSAPGHEPITLELEVGAGANVPVVAQLTRSSGGAAPPKAEADPASEGAEEAPAPPPAQGGAGWVPWVLASGGAALGLGALVMQGAAVSSASKAESKAEDGQAQSEVDDLHGEAVTAQFMAIGLGVTALALVGGATWMWLGPDEAVAVGAAPGGVVVHARF